MDRNRSRIRISSVSRDLQAIPVFGAMMALAAVAPMLASLGSMFGGGGDEGGKEDGMEKISSEIRSTNRSSI
mgnify:CR=1 FL=1